MSAPPTGTVTLLFTDIEGSTHLLHDLGPEAYAKELAEHRRLLRGAFARYGGVETMESISARAVVKTATTLWTHAGGAA